MTMASEEKSFAMVFLYLREGVRGMVYLLSFKLSQERINNPNIYPYNVFRGKDIEPFIFSTITIFL